MSPVWRVATGQLDMPLFCSVETGMQHGMAAITQGHHLKGRLSSDCSPVSLVFQVDKKVVLHLIRGIVQKGHQGLTTNSVLVPYAIAISFCFLICTLLCIPELDIVWWILVCIVIGWGPGPVVKASHHLIQAYVRRSVEDMCLPASCSSHLGLNTSVIPHGVQKKLLPREKATCSERRLQYI